MEAQSQSPSNSAGSGWRRRSWIAAVGVAAVVAAFLLVKSLTGDDGDEGAATGTVTGPAGKAFTILRPAGWRQLSEVEVERLPGSPLAVIRREDGKGVVVVNAQREPVTDFDKTSRGLDRKLANAIPDFKKVNSRSVKVKSGQALLYSYVRTRKGTAYSVLVVPAVAGSYTVNAAVPAGADEVARQVGKMLLSFDL